MTGAIPTLGYPTRTAAVVALLRQGKSEQEVAREIGITRSTVSALRCSSERPTQGRTIRSGVRAIELPLDVLQRFSAAARKRGISRETLVRMVVERVAQDELFDAVLDDEADQ